MNARHRALALALIFGGAFAFGAPASAVGQSIALPEPIGMASGDPGVRLVLDGNAAFLRGEVENAAADYRAALRTRPDFAVARFNLGLVEMHENSRLSGLRDMDRGIALASAHGMGRAYVGRLRALREAFASVPTADA